MCRRSIPICVNPPGARILVTELPGGFRYLESNESVLDHLSNALRIVALGVELKCRRDVRIRQVDRPVDQASFRALRPFVEPLFCALITMKPGLSLRR